MKNLLKILSIYIIIVISIVALYSNVTIERQKQLENTQSELDGVRYLKDIYYLSINVARYQGHLAFEKNQTLVDSSKTNVTKYINIIRKHQELHTKFKNNELSNYLKELKTFTNKNTNEFYNFLDFINHENYRIGDVSKLLFEEDRKAYFLISLITHYMPEYLISTLNSHNIVEELVNKGSISNTKKDIFREQNKLIYLSSKEISGIIKLLKKHDDTKVLFTLINKILYKLDKLSQKNNSISYMKNNPQMAKKYLDSTHEILELSYKLNDSNIEILESTLSNRKIVLQETIFSYKVAVLFILFLISIIMFYFHRSINANIKKDLEIKKMHNTMDKLVVFSKTDTTGKVTYVSSALEDICGYSSKELLGTKFEALKSDKMDRSIFKDLWSTILANKKWFGEIQNRSKDGNLYWLKTTITPDLDKKGQVIGFNSFAVDISNLKKLEIEKHKTQKALEFRSQFLSNMSHEIRTPLNSILSLIHIIMISKLDEKQKFMLNKVNSASTILLGVVNDILDISKIESGKMTLEKEPLNLKECVENIYDMLLIKAQENAISLEIIYENISNVNLIGDSLRISQVLTNLITNAIKFTEEGGVTITIKDIGNDVFRFEVKDTGIGLKQEQLSKLFEEFTQADMSTSRKYGGTGLGLSISKNLVEMMSGKIWVESEHGIGSTFIFEIPLKSDLTDRNFEKKNIENMDEIKYKIHHVEGINILVAEDNKMNQMVLEMLLEDTHLNLDFANDGKIAVDKFNKNKYDMILMDVQMPNMNGYEATDIIRSIDKEIPIVGLSANAMAEDVKKALKHGMDDYLIKPIELDKFCTAIYKHLHL